MRRTEETWLCDRCGVKRRPKALGNDDWMSVGCYDFCADCDKDFRKFLSAYGAKVTAHEPSGAKDDCG